jgi:hypothetical protein
MAFSAVLAYALPLAVGFMFVRAFDRFADLCRPSSV